MEDILKYMFEKNEEKIKIDRDENKEIINKIIDNAKKGYIVVSDKGCYVSGSRIAIKALTATLLEKLLEQKTIDKNDLNLPTWDYAEDGLEEGYPDDVIVSGFVPVQNQERLLSLKLIFVANLYLISSG